MLYAPLRTVIPEDADGGARSPPAAEQQFASLGNMEATFHGLGPARRSLGSRTAEQPFHQETCTNETAWRGSANLRETVPSFTGSFASRM